MKKVISILLCAVIIISSVAISAFAEPEIEIKGDITEYPVIVVPGYSAAWLMYGDDPEAAECAWSGLNFDDLLPRLLDRIYELAAGLAVMNIDNANWVAKVLSEEIKNTWPLMGCNPDGTSKYDLKPYYFDAKDTYTSILEEKDAGYSIHDRENASIICDYIGKENVYNFNVDWRMGMEYCSAKLNEYIKSVKEFSGSEKVNILAISQGGQTAATYLTLYGNQNDVDNVVLSSPAIGGSALASDLLSRNAHIDEQGIMRMVEHGMFMEDDYEWLLRANELGFLDKIFDALIPYLADSLGYWESIWDFVPTEYYEDLRDEYLSSPECAPLAEKSDRFHYEILPQVTEKLRECQKNGMNISIITGTGDRMLSGLDVYADGIIPVSSATGATCAPYGERFCDGYTQVNDWNGQYKVSPDMTIDASTCYLPDNTWFSIHNFHGWTWFSDCTKELAMTLLLTDRITDVYSDKDHPQFLYSDNLSETISFDLNSDVSGMIDNNTKSITVRNLLSEKNVKITAVYCPELNLKFNVGKGIELAPGESREITFSGNIPEVSKKCVHFTVCYKADTNTPLNYKTRGFTVMNGENLNGSGTTAVNENGVLDNINIPIVSPLLKKLGLYELVSMLITIVYSKIFNLV